MNIGTVKWFSLRDGFGLIEPDDDVRDVFVHISAVERAGLGALHSGQRLRFDMDHDPTSGNLGATNLRAI